MYYLIERIINYFIYFILFLFFLKASLAASVATAGRPMNETVPAAASRKRRIALPGGRFNKTSEVAAAPEAAATAAPDSQAIKVRPVLRIQIFSIRLRHGLCGSRTFTHFWSHKTFILIGFFWIFKICFLYSSPLRLPSLRFHCVGGCRDRTQDCCNFVIDSQTPLPLG